MLNPGRIIPALASQLTLDQQVSACFDAQEYYNECRADGMEHGAAQKAAVKHHIECLQAMVNEGETS